MTVVALPNGQNAEFPDSMSRDQIKSVIQRKFPPQNINLQSQSMQKQPGQNEGYIKNTMDFYQKNLVDPIGKNIVQPLSDASSGFVQGLMNVAPGLVNAGISGINSVGGNIQKVPMFNYAPDNMASKVGDIASYFVPGTLAMKALKTLPESYKAAELIQKYPKIAYSAGNALLGSAYDPSSPLIGAALGAISPALGDLTGAAFNGLSAIAEKLNPVKYGIDKLNKIKSDYANAREIEQSKYGPVMDNFGDREINYDNYLNTYEENKKYLGPGAKDLHEQFIQDPTVSNAHRLQSQLFSEQKQLSKKFDPDQATRDRIYVLNKTRNSLNDDFMNSLKSMDEGAYNSYNEGKEIHRDVIRPYFSTPTLANIVEGDVSSISPSKLSSTINKGVEKGKSKGGIPEGHALRDDLSDLQSKTESGKTWQNAISLIAGAAAGGLGGGLMSPLAAIGTKLLSKSATDLIQSPSIVNAVSKSLPWINSAGKSIAPISINLNNSNSRNNNQ